MHPVSFSNLLNCIIFSETFEVLVIRDRGEWCMLKIRGMKGDNTAGAMGLAHSAFSHEW